MNRRTFVKLEIAFLLAIPACMMVINCAGLPDIPFTIVYVIAYFYLVTGWALFLSRVLPDMVIDWFSLGLGGACLIALVCGLHFFCAWLHREIAMKRAGQQFESEQEHPALPTWRLRATLSLIGIVVLMFVAGIAAVGSVHQLVWLGTRP